MKSLLALCLLILLSHQCKVEIKDNEMQPDPESQPLTISREHLGNMSWLMFHYFAGGYPENPSDDEKAAFKDLIKGFRYLFPCEMCRGHFRKMTNENPLDNSGKLATSKYFCKIHNIVNKRLGKPEFLCDRVPDVYEELKDLPQTVAEA